MKRSVVWALHLRPVFGDSTRRLYSTSEYVGNLVGFVGLGNMGGPMAANLLKAGVKVVAFDPSHSALSKLEGLGAQAAGSPKQVAETPGLRAVVTMLPSTEIVQEVYEGSFGILAAANGVRAPLLIDSSTIAPHYVAKLAAKVCATPLHSESFRGLDSESAQRNFPSLLDAPVSGGTAGAEQGTLTFMCGGMPAAFKEAQPLFQLMGKKAVLCGAWAGAGQAAKLCNNLALSVQMAGLCEALALGRRLGLDPGLLSDVMAMSSAKCWTLEHYNPCPGVMPTAPASRGYQPGFSAGLMAKDVRLALEAAAQLHQQGRAELALPLGQQVLRLYEQVASSSSTPIDFSAIFQHVYHSGLAGPPPAPAASAITDTTTAAQTPSSTDPVLPSTTVPEVPASYTLSQLLRADELLTTMAPTLSPEPTTLPDLQPATHQPLPAESTPHHTTVTSRSTSTDQDGVVTYHYHHHHHHTTPEVQPSHSHSHSYSLPSTASLSTWSPSAPSSGFACAISNAPRVQSSHFLAVDDSDDDLVIDDLEDCPVHSQLRLEQAMTSHRFPVNPTPDPVAAAALAGCPVHSQLRIEHAITASAPPPPPVNMTGQIPGVIQPKDCEVRSQLRIEEAMTAASNPAPVHLTPLPEGITPAKDCQVTSQLRIDEAMTSSPSSRTTPATPSSPQLSTSRTTDSPEVDPYIPRNDSFSTVSQRSLSSLSTAALGMLVGAGMGMGSEPQMLPGGSDLDLAMMEGSDSYGLAMLRLEEALCGMPVHS